jgi:hypothetical protein
LGIVGGTPGGPAVSVARGNGRLGIADGAAAP